VLGLVSSVLYAKRFAKKNDSEITYVLSQVGRETLTQSINQSINQSIASIDSGCMYKNLIRRCDSERKLFHDDTFNHFYVVCPGNYIVSNSLK